MAGLEGDVKTPFGSVSKKTGLIIVGAAVVVFGYTYYRTKKAKDAAAVAASGANTEIDPATGYAYGSPEDAAALSAQAAYVQPTGSGGGGGSSTGAYPSGSFTTNAAWSQAVLAYFQSSGSFPDTSALSLAIGKYLAGDPLTADQKGLVEQAIAVEGYPPVNGPSGYPPNINTVPVPPSGSGSSGGGTGGTPAPTGGYDTSKWQATGTVLPGYKVDGWISDLIAQGKVPPNFTYENTLKPRNPGIEKNIVWHTNSAQNYFKAKATYNLKW